MDDMQKFWENMTKPDWRVVYGVFPGGGCGAHFQGALSCLPGQNGRHPQHVH